MSEMIKTQFFNLTTHSSGFESFSIIISAGQFLFLTIKGLKASRPQIPILIFTASLRTEDLRAHLADA